LEEGAAITLSRSAAVAHREPLGRERIEFAALEVIEREGLAAFSIRKLAQELGCEAMSVYHYFPSKAHLMDALLDRVLEELPPPPRELPWIERLRRMAVDIRSLALARPEFFQFMALHRMNTRGGLKMLEEAIGTFRDAGFDDEMAARLFRAFSYYIVGAGLDEAAGYSRGPSAVEPVPDEVVAKEFPNVAAAGPFFRPQQREATYEAGLEMLLQGVAKKAADLGRARGRKRLARTDKARA
jgi:AcrR family transcriptional regulator